MDIQERSYNFFTEIRDFVKEKLKVLEEYLTLSELKSDVLRRLFEDSKK